MKRTRRRRPGHTARQHAWNRSPACADAARRGRIAAEAVRAAAPKCGAKLRGREARCQGLALENGRCRLHGGLTPRGAEWHRVQWNGGSEAKLERKLRNLERRRKALKARLAKMTPAERALYEKRSRAASGTPAERAARRLALDFSELRRSEEPRQPDPEAAALAADLAAARADRVRIEALIVTLANQENETDE